MSLSRDKVLARLANLLRLARSPNEHEARLAKERADDLVKKYEITDEEVVRAVAEPVASTVGPRFAGSISWWREQLAVVIAEKMGCKPLSARGRLFFDGESAVDAVIQFRRIADEIEHTCRCYLTGGAAIWLRVFRAALGEDRTATVLGYGEAVRLVRRAATESMVLRNGLVLVTSRQPGNYATVFCGEQKFLPRGDMFKFDDAAQNYLWAFEQRGTVSRGQHVVFATEDREVVGELTGSWIRIVSRSAKVSRSTHGEPVRVERVL